MFIWLIKNDSWWQNYKMFINTIFLFCLTAGVRVGAVWARECRTAGIRKLCPPADRRSLPGHPGAGGQCSGGVMLTGPDRTAEPSAASSSLPSFPSLFSSALISQDAKKKNTNSLTFTHMHNSKDRHIWERLTAHKSRARLDWVWGVGTVSFPSAIPYHHIHPLCTLT